MRGRGLLLGLELDPQILSAPQLALRLQDEGILTRDVHDHVVRLAPPLVISRPQIEQALAAIRRALA